jgi:hypothetical protein
VYNGTKLRTAEGNLGTLKYLKISNRLSNNPWSEKEFKIILS